MIMTVQAILESLSARLAKCTVPLVTLAKTADVAENTIGKIARGSDRVTLRSLRKVEVTLDRIEAAHNAQD